MEKTMKHTTPTFKEIEKEIDYWTSVEDKKYMFVKKSTIKSFIRKHIIKMMESERDKIWQKCFDIMFELTQSHDCDKDTACKFEDRAFRALRKMEKIK